MKKILLSIIMMVVSTAFAVADNTIITSRIGYEKKQSGGLSNILVDFPIGLDNATRRTIIDYIFERCKALNSAVDIPVPQNTCDESEFEKYLEEYTTIVCRLCAEDQNEYASSLDDETEIADWFATMFIEKVSETDQYVSYAAYYGEFCGGAHDQRGSDAITISKADGKRIGEIFKEGVEEEMQPLLWKYLIESEAPENPDEYREEINKFLKANYNYEDFIHLPSGTTYLTSNAVCIMYQPLEICFWPNEPTIAIPIDEAKPYLTAEALRLIEAE